MSKKEDRTGHRSRLRSKFLTAPEKLSDVHLLELLLTFAIPRQDVAKLSQNLLKTFGSLGDVFTASQEDLKQIKGVGENTIALIRAVDHLRQRTLLESVSETSTEEENLVTMEMNQPELFSMADEKSTGEKNPKPPPPPPTKADIRAYTNDLIKVTITHLPAVINCENFAEFSAYLEVNLPYNSANTRNRYTRYLTNRYYPDGTILTPLTRLLSYHPEESTWKAVLFYETVKAEPAVQFMAEQVIWPALPTGTVSRDSLKENLGKRFAEASEATISRMIYSLVNLYTMCDVVIQQDGLLKFQTRQGSLTSFLYVLVSQFSEPGIYSFEALEQGPARRWLLWDREWIRRQLYNLRDLDIIAKISEIDAMRQFTLSLDQATAIKNYFEHPRWNELVLRESSATVKSES